MSKMSNEEQKNKSRGNWITVLIVLFILTILAVIALPEFLRLRPYQGAEARQNLKAVYSAYQIYHSENNSYPTEPIIQIASDTYSCLQAADWAPTGRLRYNYECMDTVVYWPGWEIGRKPQLIHCPGAVTGATKESFTVAACTNMEIDDKLYYDVWTIDENKNLRNISQSNFRNLKLREKYNLWSHGLLSFTQFLKLI